ncbi:MAG: MmgE/PrpD family protein [Alphaproteobacteria bacterium]
MTVLESFADMVLAARDAPLSPARADVLALRVFDTAGALIAGRNLPEIAPFSDMAAGVVGLPEDGAVPTVAIMHSVAAARATEIDDIHLGACVTPSAVIVPVALLMGRVEKGDELLRALSAGYEAMVRFGCAVGGPSLLARGIWPTQLCAGIGASATVGALLGLTRDQLVNALGFSISLAAGINARGAFPTGRWAPVGIAAANGALAAALAGRGLRADIDLLDGRWSTAIGISLDAAVLGSPGADTANEISFKPWCGARQTMAAVAAFRTLVEEDGLSPELVREVTVAVPAAYRGMIDRPRLAADRQESFADLRFNLGLAAFYPDGLYDVVRAAIPDDRLISALAGKVRVVADGGMTAHYPRRWPAVVTVVGNDGKVHKREVIDVPGDPGTNFGWDVVGDKLARATGLPADRLSCLRDRCASLATGVAAADVLSVAGL